MAEKKRVAPSSNEKPVRGRPPLYTADLAARICAAVASGRTLREVCRSEDMPDESTVRSWVLSDREGFSTQYARAREMQVESWTDEMLELSDDGSNDWMERNHGEGDTETVPNHDHISRSRLRVDTRKWLASKLLPKVYGEKITQDLNILTDPESATDEQIKARLAAIAARRQMEQSGR